MFPPRYFAARYFAARYWPPIVAVVAGAISRSRSRIGQTAGRFRR